MLTFYDPPKWFECNIAETDARSLNWNILHFICNKIICYDWYVIFFSIKKNHADRLKKKFFEKYIESPRLIIDKTIDTRITVIDMLYYSDKM